MYFFLRDASAAYGSSWARGWIRATAASLPQPQQRGIWAASTTYITVLDNARSLIHWARLGIEPVSSRMLVGFVTNEPQQELPLLPFKSAKSLQLCLFSWDLFGQKVCMSWLIRAKYLCLIKSNLGILFSMCLQITMCKPVTQASQGREWLLFPSPNSARQNTLSLEGFSLSFSAFLSPCLPSPLPPSLSLSLCLFLSHNSTWQFLCMDFHVLFWSVN